jgi:hypothetical protein
MESIPDAITDITNIWSTTVKSRVLIEQRRYPLPRMSFWPFISRLLVEWLQGSAFQLVRLY